MQFDQRGMDWLIEWNSEKVKVRLDRQPVHFKGVVLFSSFLDFGFQLFRSARELRWIAHCRLRPKLPWLTSPYLAPGHHRLTIPSPGAAMVFMSLPL